MSQQPIVGSLGHALTEQAPNEEALVPFRKPDLKTVLSIYDFEAIASKSFSPKTWAFISSAATDLHTKTRNTSTYSRITLRPRVLRDVSRIDMSTTMLGHKLRVPIFTSPAAMACLVHPDGEKAVARAVKASGSAQCVSMYASYPLGEIIDAARDFKPDMPHEMPMYLQFYFDKVRERTAKQLEDAQRRGVVGLFLTVDAGSIGKREADERIQLTEEVTQAGASVAGLNDTKGGGLGRSLTEFMDNSVTWDDISWVRQCVPKLKIVLKGIQTADDALLALQAGVDGIIISNHGGRTLDTGPAAILVLMELHKRCPRIFTSMDVMIDGGIRRGTDIFKALCLGAKAVGLGRATLYSLNYGYDGVLKLFDIMLLLVLRDELEATMKLCGVTSIDQLHAGYLNTLDVDHLIPGTEAGQQMAPKSRL
ncbi:hypothetical protein PWT90_01106 [Aphanocladium album]|nr:hypothetical protein PWT90_01106 [Aphanocladium album]